MSAFAGQPPVCRMLPDNKRMHCQHGPIDLVIEADGPEQAVRNAYLRAAGTFTTILSDLVSEIDILRSAWNLQLPVPECRIALSMWRAAACFGSTAFVTPMIAVAGAVADHVLREILKEPGLTRAYVNNGGDIAIWCGPATRFRVGMCNDQVTGTIAGTATITHGDGVGGLATSGWKGRSHSLGIADAVTVLAVDAATADAAATLIANAVNLPDNPKIERIPANLLSPDSDLGDRPVTTNVSELDRLEVEAALAAGVKSAGTMLDAGLIKGAAIMLQARVAYVCLNPGAPNLHYPAEQERITAHA